MRTHPKKLIGIMAMTMLTLGLIPNAAAQEVNAAAQEVTGVAVDAPIWISPELASQLTPEELAELRAGNGTSEPKEKSDVSIRSWQNCGVYENRTWPIANRLACFHIQGSGLWADLQNVIFQASRSGQDPYTYVNARYNVDRPNGQTWWGTGGGAVNIMNGHSRTVHINNFIEAGNWCLRYQLQRTNGVWENWKEVCGPVWA